MKAASLHGSEDTVTIITGKVLGQQIRFRAVLGIRTDPDLTILTRFIIFKNISSRWFNSSLIINLHISPENLKNTLKALSSVPFCTLKICQLIRQPCLKGRIRKDLKIRIWIQTKSFRIHNTDFKPRHVHVQIFAVRIPITVWAERIQYRQSRIRLQICRKIINYNTGIVPVSSKIYKNCFYGKFWVAKEKQKPSFENTKQVQFYQFFQQCNDCVIQ